MQMALQCNRGILWLTGAVLGWWYCFRCHVALLHAEAARLGWDLAQADATKLVQDRLRGVVASDTGRMVADVIRPVRTAVGRRGAVWPPPLSALLVTPHP